MGDLSDFSPLVSAAASGKLRLVRLLVEGGAHVNGCNLRGETALLVACKTLRGQPAGTESLKLITFLLQNKADPNTQDQAGRTALMYACMQRAALVASTLLSAGADPSVEDHSGASALVYAINAQHEPTLKVMIDGCRARGRDIVIIATQMTVNGGAKCYLNVPSSPDTSPVSCMSPSDIVLKTSCPNSPEGGNIFNFRGTSRRGGVSSGVCRQRGLSEPWLTIPNLAYLNSTYEKSTKERDDTDREDLRRDESEDETAAFQFSTEATGESRLQRSDRRTRPSSSCPQNPRISQSVLSLTEVSSFPVATESHPDRLPPCPAPFSQLRRNTMPSLSLVPPVLHLPPLVNQSDSYLKIHSQASSSKSEGMLFLPHPPSSAPPPSSRASVRSALLKPWALGSSAPSLVVPPASDPSNHSEKPAHIKRGQH